MYFAPSPDDDNWPEFVLLAELAINDSASPLGLGYTRQFYADRVSTRAALSSPGRT